MTEFKASEIISNTLRKLHDYWASKKRHGALPSRDDIDPIEIPKLLTHLFLVEILPEEPVYKFRLSGSITDEIHGQSLTGKTVDDIRSKEIIPIVKEYYRQVQETAEPLCSFFTVMAEDGRYWSYERILLPLSQDGKVVNMLLGGAAPVPPGEYEENPPAGTLLKKQPGVNSPSPQQ